MALKDIPTTYLSQLLLNNPLANSFPLGIAPYGPDVPRSALQAELNSRAPVDNQIVGVNPNPVSNALLIQPNPHNYKRTKIQYGGI